MTARLHVDEHLLDRGHPELEAAREVLLVQGDLPLDVAEQREVVGEQREPLVGNRRVLLSKRVGDPQRVRQFEAKPAALVQRFADGMLQGLEAARGPQLRLAVPGAQGKPRADGKHFGCNPEQTPRRVAHECQDFVQLGVVLEDVDLVDHDDDLFAPVADRLQECPFRFRERPVGGGDKKDEVRPGYELGRQPLVLADDRVGPGGVNDVDIAKQLGRCGDDPDTVFAALRAHQVGMLQQMDLSGCGRHAFLEHALADERVDEGALAGVELADHDEQKELVKLMDRRGQGGLILGGCRQAGQRVAYLCQELTRLGELFLERGGQDSLPHSC